jgi:hypothetical protein
VDLERAKGQNQLTAALLRGVEVENGLRGVAERARMPILSLDPTGLGDVAQHGGGVEDPLSEEEGAGGSAVGLVRRTISHPVVMLKAPTPVKEAPNRPPHTGSDGIHECMSHDLLYGQFNHIVHLGARRDRVDAQSWVSVAEGR